MAKLVLPDFKAGKVSVSSMFRNKKSIKVFRSVMEDKPPNPFTILLALPVALFCVIVSYLDERFNKRDN